MTGWQIATVIIAFWVVASIPLAFLVARIASRKPSYTPRHATPKPRVPRTGPRPDVRDPQPSPLAVLYPRRDAVPPPRRPESGRPPTPPGEPR